MGMNAGKKGPMAEINVTPLVDVMLVLLVIFMISAPLMFNGVKLQLPQTKKVNTLNLDSKQVVLSVSKNGDYFLGKEVIEFDNLINGVKKALAEYQKDVLFLRADYSLNYGAVAKLMAQLKSEGIANIALVTEIEK